MDAKTSPRTHHAHHCVRCAGLLAQQISRGGTLLPPTADLKLVTSEFGQLLFSSHDSFLGSRVDAGPPSSPAPLLMDVHRTHPPTTHPQWPAISAGSMGTATQRWLQTTKCRCSHDWGTTSAPTSLICLSVHRRISYQAPGRAQQRSCSSPSFGRCPSHVLRCATGKVFTAIANA